MKTSYLLQLILLLVVSSASTIAVAATMKAQEITYFDQAGNVIGYQYLNCQNSALHAGTLSSSYMVIQHWICPDSATTCTWNAATTKWTCVPSSASTMYKNVAYISTADGISAQQFCAYQVPGNVYGQTLSCSASAPEPLIGFSYLTGWE